MRHSKHGQRDKDGHVTVPDGQTLGIAPKSDLLQRTVGNEAAQRLIAQSAGQPLPAEVLARMDSSFGYDFSGVRIHTGADAAMAARAANAKAYTIGQDIVFGDGHYSPGTSAGNQLLSHELAHVVQQSRGGIAPSSQSDVLLEAGADAAAAAVVQGQNGVHVSGAAAVGMSRQPDDPEEERRKKDSNTSASPTPSEDDNAPQANLPLLTLLNGPFFGGNNPIGTLSTDLFGTFAGQSATAPAGGATFLPSFQLQVRDRLTATGEIGFFGTVGSSTGGSGAVGITWHGGPESPDDKTRHIFGLGYYLTLGQYWGLEPPRTDMNTPPGWSFNPTASGMLSLGWARAEHSEFDLVLSGSIGRWGQVNGVPVGGIFSPYIGASYMRNLTRADSLTVEGSAGTNLGLAGRFDAGTGLPASLTFSGGVAYQHLWGDWGFGVEPWVFGEAFSNASNTGAPDYNWGVGLRIGVTAINPRRRFPDEK